MTVRLRVVVSPRARSRQVKLMRKRVVRHYDSDIAALLRGVEAGLLVEPNRP